MSVPVYSTPTCGHCQAAKRFLRDRHVRFREIDVSKDARAEAEIARKTGRHSVPVIDVNGRLFVGFDPRRLAAALGLKG